MPTVAGDLPTLAAVAAEPVEANARLGRNTTFANLLGLAAVAVPARRDRGPVPRRASPCSAHRRRPARSPRWRPSWPASACSPATAPAGGRTQLAVVGAHLRGQPLNGQLTDRGGELVATTTTAPRYRLHLLEGGPPLRPGLERVGDDDGGAAVEVEVWTLDDAGFGAFTAAVPPPLGIGSIELADGRWVKGFVCEPLGLRTATDITAHGGWRAFLAQRTSDA